MADALVIKGLSKRFGGLRAVQDVSFTVAENETVALIGPNGAGKTTSFHLMSGFHRPDSGSVLAFGRDIVGLKPHDICALGMARTFQVAKPFGAMTVLANVMTGAFLRDRHVAAARAISSRRWSIVVKSLAAVCAFAASPTNSIASSALARAAATWRSRRKAPVMTFASTVIAPKGLATWKVRAMPSAQISCGFNPTMSRPNARTEPESGR